MQGREKVSARQLVVASWWQGLLPLHSEDNRGAVDNQNTSRPHGVELQLWQKAH